MNWFKNIKLRKKFGLNLNSGKLSLRDQVELFNFMADFLKNGFSLSMALSFYQTLNHQNQDAINKVKRALASGVSFSRGIRPFINNSLYYQIRIAEYHGDLITVLDEINRFLTVKKKQREKLVGLLVYPAFLLMLLMALIIAIHSFITPQLQSSTQVTESSHHLDGIGVLLGLLLLLAGWWLVIRYRRMNQLTRVNWLLRVPIIGRLCSYYYAYYLSSNLALMMKCGISLQQIVDFMCRMKNNLILVSLGKEIEHLINNGGSEWELKRRFRFIPLRMLILINSGDSSIVLAQKLKSYSTLCFNKLVRLSYRLIALVQPIMFLIIGLVIVGTYLSMLLPMYDSIRGVY